MSGFLAEAIRWTGRDSKSVFAWLREDELGLVTLVDYGRCLVIKTPDGARTASPGDWIIRDAAGLHGCAPDVFAASYEPAENALSPTLQEAIRERDDARAEIERLKSVRHPEVAPRLRQARD